MGELITFGLLFLFLLYLGRVVSNKFEKFRERKVYATLVTKLTSEFPSFTGEFTSHKASEIIESYDRREKDLIKFWNNNDEVIEPYEFERSSYFTHIFSDNFRNVLDNDLNCWQRFVLSIVNSRYDPYGKNVVLWLGDDGKITSRSAEE